MRYSISYLRGGFPLRCFQRLSVGNLATRRCSYSETTGTPGIPSSQSSRTRDEFPQISTIVQDRDRTVLRRSEPSSRTTLTGEQPDPWDLLQPQDVMSRHRGAKPPRRCELLGEISLLSPAYLLSFERWPFHAEPPDHFSQLSFLFDPSVSQSSTLILIRSSHDYRPC